MEGKNIMMEDEKDKDEGYNNEKDNEEGDDKIF